LSKILDEIRRGRRKRARRIIDLDIDEISLVDRAATGRTFLVKKAEDGEGIEKSKTSDALEALLAPILAGGPANLPTLEAAVKAIEVVHADMPSDVMEAIQSLALALIAAAKSATATKRVPSVITHVDGTKEVLKNSDGSDPWASVSGLTLPMLARVRPEIFDRLLAKRAEVEGPDERDAAIEELLDENETLRALRSPSQQIRAGYVEASEAIRKGGEAVDLWPSLSGSKE
jgi:hypothetical protein